MDYKERLWDQAGEDSAIHAILDYLFLQTDNQKLIEGLNDETKDVNEMMKYIKSEAKKHCNNSNVAMMTDCDVFNTAIYYFTNEIKEIKNENATVKVADKPEKKETKQVPKEKDNKKTDIEYREKRVKRKDEKLANGQLSFFD